MAAANPSPSQRWLFGPLPDLLLGCGALYIVAFVFFATSGEWILSLSPSWLAPLCVLALSLPHYGATLVRVYEHRTDRRAYAIFSVWATIALALAFVAGVYHVGVGSVLLTVYLTWSPWHYTGQNYGLAVMFLRRRGLPAVGATKRWLHASFVLSYILSFCVIHESATWADARSLPSAGSSVHFIPIGLPGAEILTALAAAGWVLATLVALALMLRVASVRDLIPVGMLLVTQALWFAIPGVALHWGIFSEADPLDPNSLGAFLVWIAVGHAVQYLWVTSYYAKAARDWDGALSYFTKTLTAGALVWTLPFVVFAAGPLGAPSYETGLAFLVASVVNLHHFILDGAIWKLRNTRIAKVLILSGRSAENEGEASRSVLGRATQVLAFVCLVIALAVFGLENWLLPSAIAAAEPARAAVVLDRLDWFGRDSSFARAEAGRLWAEDQQFALALEQYERSAVLLPRAQTYGHIALMHGRLRDVEASARAQDRALALEPHNASFFEWSATLSEELHMFDRAADLRARAAALSLSPASTPEKTGGPALY